MTLKGRHAIVTGGGTGVGAEIAKALKQEGAAVTILGRREGPLKEQGLPWQTCDVTDHGSVEKAVAAARSEQGPVSIVVANAGAAASYPFERMTPADFEALLAVNLVGVANTWRAVLPDMKESGWGRMIAVASIAGLKGFNYISGYCAAKHGVVGMTKALSIELAQAGITVNAVCPGYINTPMLDRAVENVMEKTGMTEDEAMTMFAGQSPQNRLIEVDEVASAVLWLCSEAAKSVTGHALAISGGEV